MVALVWDQIGERLYETGIDKGVLYIPGVGGAYDTGFAWNGLISVTEAPSGADATALYADNIKYLNLIAAEEFGCTIEAYTYPEEFGQCDGTDAPEVGMLVGQQSRKSFGLSYRSILGNDAAGDEFGYKLHLVYGCRAAPSEKAYSTVNDSPDAITFSWEVSTTPAPITGLKPTALIVVDSSLATPTGLAALEEALHGGAAEPQLPTPDEVIVLLATV